MHLLVLLRIVSLFFLLTSIMRMPGEDSIPLRGWGTKATGGSDIGMLCIEVHLHAVQPHGGHTQGAVGARKWVVLPNPCILGGP